MTNTAMTGKTLGQIAREEHIIASDLDREARWTAVANAVKAAIAKWPKCSKCNGVGYLFSAENACPACGGLGRVENV